MRKNFELPNNMMEFCLQLKKSIDEYGFRGFFCVGVCHSNSSGELFHFQFVSQSNGLKIK